MSALLGSFQTTDSGKSLSNNTCWKISKINYYILNVEHQIIETRAAIQQKKLWTFVQSASTSWRMDTQARKSQVVTLADISATVNTLLPPQRSSKQNMKIRCHYMLIDNGILATQSSTPIFVPQWRNVGHASKFSHVTFITFPPCRELGHDHSTIKKRVENRLGFRKSIPICSDRRRIHERQDCVQNTKKDDENAPMFAFRPARTVAPVFLKQPMIERTPVVPGRNQGKLRIITLRTWCRRAKS